MLRNILLRHSMSVYMRKNVRVRGGMMRLGTTELILILIIAIALFGTTRIAGIGKAMGKSIREFKEELNTDTEAAKKEDGNGSDGKA